VGDRDISGLCCYFNPSRSRQRLRNYERFRKLLAGTGMPLLTVELAFSGNPFDLHSSRDVIQLRGGDVMWQKERLLQIGAERLIDEGYDKLVFLDADIIFEKSSWPRLVSRALEKFPVVQCFSSAIRNYSDSVRTQESAVKTYLEGGKPPSAARGIAWALSSEIFLKAGLYQHCVAGGGDTALCLAALGLARENDEDNSFLQKQNFFLYPGPTFQSHYLKWAETLFAATGNLCSYVDQAVFTLSHGSRRSRAYSSRHLLLADFDPQNEVAIDQTGAFVWDGRGSHRKAAVQEYILGRGDGLQGESPAHSEPSPGG
jgi:hypothetical protein